MGQLKHGFRETLALLFRARFPVLYVESFEEHRVLDEVRAVATDQTVMRTVRPVYVWSSRQGVRWPGRED